MVYEKEERSSPTCNALRRSSISCIVDTSSPSPPVPPCSDLSLAISALNSLISLALGTSFTFARLTIDRACWAYLVGKTEKCTKWLLQLVRLCLLSWKILDSEKWLAGHIYWILHVSSYNRVCTGGNYLIMRQETKTTCKPLSTTWMSGHESNIWGPRHTYIGSNMSLLLLYEVWRWVHHT